MGDETRYDISGLLKLCVFILGGPKVEYRAVCVARKNTEDKLGCDNPHDKIPVSQLFPLQFVAK